MTARVEERRALLFEGVVMHAVLLGLLLGALAMLARTDGFLAGEAFGLSTRAWLELALAAPIVHQVYMWLVWRLELHTRLFTRRFGSRALRVHGAIFGVLIAMRAVTIAGLAVANQGTLLLPTAALRAAAILLALPALYCERSVFRYLGYLRATGADHFDPAWREPLVRRGIFRWSSNAMYAFGFLVVYLPGLWFASKASLAAAVFSHAYIWVHYWCTERPDMARIYGERS